MSDDDILEIEMIPLSDEMLGYIEIFERLNMMIIEALRLPTSLWTEAPKRNVRLGDDGELVEE